MLSVHVRNLYAPEQEVIDIATILMVNLPYAGHTNPTLPLATQLALRGHSVRYINAPEWREPIESTGAAFIPYQDYPAGLSDQQKKTRCFLAAYQTAMEHGRDADLVLYEMLFYPAKWIADHFGIPCVRQFSQPAWNPYSFDSIRSSSRLFLTSCKLIDKQMMNRRTAKAIGAGSDTGLVQSVLHDRPSLNIVYLPEDFQPFRETFDSSYLFVGSPAVPATQASDEPSPFEKLRKPLIYISLGTIISSNGFYRRCIKAFGDKDCSVVMATGRVAPESLGALPGNITAYSFAPQMEILRHADLFLTHGGMNSVNEAIYNGVPMLVLPIVNDQPINADQVARLGIGKRMSFLSSSASRLFAAAKSVMEDASYLQRAKQLQGKAGKHTGAAVAADEIEMLLGSR